MERGGFVWNAVELSLPSDLIREWTAVHITNARQNKKGESQIDLNLPAVSCDQQQAP
jgi:hypothetical protein